MAMPSRLCARSHKPWQEKNRVSATIVTRHAKDQRHDARVKPPRGWRLDPGADPRGDADRDRRDDPGNRTVQGPISASSGSSPGAFKLEPACRPLHGSAGVFADKGFEPSSVPTHIRPGENIRRLEREGHCGPERYPRND